MNSKIEKLERDIKKTKLKITELQQKQRDMEKQKTDLENAELIAACRSCNLSPAEICEFLQTHQLPSISETNSEPTEDDYED